MSAADPFAGLNVRDLGGMPVTGGRLRSGVLLRSEGPRDFSAAHTAALAALDIALVCDLRSTVETTRNPSGWGRRTMPCDIAADFRSGADARWDDLDAAEPGAAVRERMIATYAAMPAAIAPHLGALVAAIGAGELPLLIHCTAGKDRTGVLVALLLAWLGAAPADILADYRASVAFGARPAARARIARQVEKLTGAAPGEDVVAAMLATDPAYLAAAFSAVDAGWRSIDGYLTAAGADDATRRRVRARLIDPVSD